MQKRDVFLNAANVICAPITMEATDVLAQDNLPVAFKSFNQCVEKASFEQIMAHFDSLLAPVFSTLQLSKEQCANTTLLLGSTSLDISAVQIGDNDDLWLSKTDKISQALVAKYGLAALEFTFSTACTASANACLYASRLISQGSIEHALVIGCEFYNPLTVEGFKSLDLISKTGLNAFAKSRSGLVLGEGLGALYLSATPNSQCLLKVLGGASSCDTYSLTMTKEDGSHIAQVINDAMRQSQVTANTIDLIKVHGTATLGNDEAESNALTQIFIDNRPAIVAFKPFTGHTLGACGVIEIALFNQFIAKSIPFLPIPEYVNNEGVELMWPFYDNEKTPSINTILFNYFGFGGNNAALVLQRV
ncbi:hypothetical protein J8L70_09570 [Pseudoalteromonas sp. MMG010]|uniref:beta-ketoacyl synthase N-terminal-like domain-containing protein n=1 Tax=Pseudoalteromonas sp. MMG010 TaxID=2822685 RepID=UPI001B3A0F65|nr:beta-ketoacyl synthase N-terminal-like domain-containing protein [Pseudoalteromonas sp. MMG010]MBQ4833486.1 hypothetical protein [Pseudoalteromonas sp. MMG010]